MTTGQNEQLTVEQIVRADRPTVFAAWTEPPSIVQWWGSGGGTCTEATVDLRVGGDYRIANRAPDGHVMWITGTYRRIEVPQELEYTWAIEPVTPDSEFSVVTVTFAEVPEGTKVTVTQERISDPSMRDVFRQGWIDCLHGLDVLVGRQPG